MMQQKERSGYRKAWLASCSSRLGPSLVGLVPSAEFEYQTIINTPMQGAEMHATEVSDAEIEGQTEGRTQQPFECGHKNCLPALESFTRRGGLEC